MITLIQRPVFRKIYKKLNPQEKEVVGEAIKKIIHHPEIGELKNGDLKGFRVFKFKMGTNQKLLGYFCHSAKEIELSYLGTHENFYRDFKKTLN